MRVWRFALALAGCGRIGFESSTTTDASDAMPADAPPLPASLVCDAQPIAIPSVASNADLAVVYDGMRFGFLWANPGGPVNALAADANGNIFQPIRTLTTGPVAGIAGAFNLGGTAVFATTREAGHDLWRVDQTDVVSLESSASPFVAKDPIVSDAMQTSRAFIRGDATGMTFTYISPTGALGADRPYATPPILALAAANNSDHTHLTWAQDNGGGVVECVQSDLDLVPNAPNIGGTASVAMDCHEPRIDSGPAASDVIFNIWRTSANAILARYHGGIDDVSMTFSTNGHGPRIRYDGTQFWAVWLQQSDGVVENEGPKLRVAKITVPSLAFTTVDLPGWTPTGDEAYELVRAGSSVYLGLLSTNTITLMKLCP